MAEQIIYSPETIIKAYSCGVFPMAQSRDDPELRFYEPAIRGVIPITPPHIPRRLIRFAKQSTWQVTFDTAFADVVRHCAEMRADNTWINAEIETLYFALHKMGFGHSVEIWDGNRLVGGLYGLSLGSAFSANQCSRQPQMHQNWHLPILWRHCIRHNLACLMRNLPQTICASLA